MTVTIVATRDGVIDAADRQHFAQFTAAAKGSKVLLHLHGGLVPEKSGRDIADRLKGGAAGGGFGLDAEWSQLYVIWRTGALETLQTNWTDLFESDRLYRAVLRNLLEFVARKLGVREAGGRSAEQHLNLNRAHIVERLNARPDADPFLDVDRAIETDTPGGRGPVIVALDEDDLTLEFEIQLIGDIEFNDAVEDLAAGVNQSAGRGVAGGGDAEAGRNSLKRLDNSIQLQAIGALPDYGGRVGTLAIGRFLLKHGGRIAVRVIRRFRARRDHGFYPTVVEELVRECYGDLVGSAIWGMMKKDGSDHFKAEGLGTELFAALGANTPKQLCITAHSAGSIWASALIKAAPCSLAPFDLALLAPAVRMDTFADALSLGDARIRRCRMFTMRDDLERKDTLLGKGRAYIYPCSLLYLVSGLFEDQKGDAFPDAPLVGMQRFHGANNSWLKDAAQIAAQERVMSFFTASDRSIVWSTVSGGPGLSSASTSHGGFDRDPATLKSVVEFFS